MTTWDDLETTAHSWFFVPAIAVKTAPTVAEINAGTGLNISCSRRDVSEADDGRLYCPDHLAQGMDAPTGAAS